MDNGILVVACALEDGAPGATAEYLPFAILALNQVYSIWTHDDTIIGI